MPRYYYKCSDCNVEFMTTHSSEELLEECEKCSTVGKLTKLLTKPSYGIKKPYEKRIGRVTEDFIEESRQELDKQRKELDRQR